MADDTPDSEETSLGKKRHSKDIIGAYLTSAGNERAELTVTDATSKTMEVVENEVNIRGNSIIAVVDDIMSRKL